MLPGTGEPDDPQQELLDGYRMRAQAQLDHARRRLARAESDRAIAASRRLRVLSLANLHRTRANQLRQRAAKARKHADAAEKQMVDERKNALEQVQARRAAYHTDLLNWLGHRAGAFAVAVSVLLIAFLAAGWRPMLAWLAFRRAGGLDGATYAKALAVTAATVALGAAAALGSSSALSGVRTPVAVPVIAAMVIVLGLIAWRSTAVRAGSAGLSPALADRRLAPGMAVGVPLALGLGIGLLGLLEGEPAEPRVAPKTAALARLAEPDPTAQPTTRVARLRRKADRADSRSRRAEARAAVAERMLRSSEDEVSAAEERTSEAKRAVDRLQRRVDDPLPTVSSGPLGG